MVNQGPAKEKKPEMFFIDLAKSKVILFAAKSCELVIFFGGLWITLVMTNHDAASWLSGSINSFFITTMAFAVDAAFPESWLHVVLQHVEQKTNQFRWSVSVAIAMTLLVALNVVGTEVKNMPDWFSPALIIVRMLVGFGYVAIRECQVLLSRKNVDQALSPTEVRDLKEEVKALGLSIESKMDEKLKGFQSEITSTFQSLKLSIERQNESLLQEIERHLTERLKGHTDEMKAFQLEEIRPLAETLYRVELGFNENLLPVTESLVQIPAFSEQLSQIETTVTQQVTRLHGALQANTQMPIPAVSATRTVKTETRRVTQPSASDFDREAFVEACLLDDHDMSISAIQRKAAERGQTLSTGTVSAYRRTFFEKQGILERPSLVTVVEAN